MKEVVDKVRGLTRRDPAGLVGRPFLVETVLVVRRHRGDFLAMTLLVDIGAAQKYTASTDSE